MTIIQQNYNMIGESRQNDLYTRRCKKKPCQFLDDAKNNMSKVILVCVNSAVVFTL